MPVPLHVNTQAPTALRLAIYQRCMSHGPDRSAFALAFPHRVLSDLVFGFPQHCPSSELLAGQIGAEFAVLPFGLLADFLHVRTSGTAATICPTIYKVPLTYGFFCAAVTAA
jgi:hypothetical protein